MSLKLKPAIQQFTRGFFSDIPPGLSRRQLAKRIGMSMNYATLLARKYGYQLTRKRTCSTDEKWLAIDWTQRDRQIAKNMNVTFQWISQLRRKLAPHTLGLGKLATKRKWKAVDWTQSNADIHKQTGLAISNTSNYRAKYATGQQKAIYRKNAAERKLHRRRQSKWANMDWHRPNRDIERETGIRNAGTPRAQYAPETVGMYNANRRAS